MKAAYFLIIILSTAIVLTLGITSCDTDVELEAPYKSTTIIIGILDYTADTQFVRINRTFLGPGYVNNYAQVKDSVEYSPAEVEAWLIKSRDGVKQDSIELKYIVKPSRDPGVFYNQDVGFYYTSEPLFTDQEITEIKRGTLTNAQVSMTYAIRVEARGKTYTATTNFPDVSESSIIIPMLDPEPVLVKMYNEVTSNYLNIEFQYKTGSETSRYLGVYRLNFDAVLADGTILTNQYIDYKLGAQDNPERVNNKKLIFEFNAASWYEFIGEKIKAIPDLKKVRIHDLEVRLTGANKMLTSYYKAAHPISEFTPVINTVTNLDNGAIGILGSRTVIVRKTHLTNSSIKIMNQGEYTSGIGLYYCVVDWKDPKYLCSH